MAYLKNATDLQIYSASLNDIDMGLRMARKSDLIIWPAEGTVIARFLEQHWHNSQLRDLFAAASVRKIAWSMDSHHQWPVEQKLQKYFDRYYLAHSPYMDKFDGQRVRWLPCYYGVSGIDSLLNSIRSVPEPVCDISCLFRAYPHIGDRNFVAYEAAKILGRMGLKFVFGSMTGAGQARYVDMLKASKVVLNISIMDDLNLRNFEAIGLNRVMLTNRVPDHERVALDYRHTYFFKRDLSDFAEKVTLALRDESPVIETWRNVVNRHMLIHRYIDMINQELGTAYCVAPVADELPCVSAVIPVRQSASLTLSSEMGDKIYSQEDLALKSILTLVHSRKNFQWALKEFEQAARLPEFLFTDQPTLLAILQETFQAVQEQAADQYAGVLLAVSLKKINQSMEQRATGFIVREYGSLLLQYAQILKIPEIDSGRHLASVWSVKMAEQHVAAGNLEAALLVLKKARELDSQYLDVYAWLGLVYRRLQCETETVEAYEKYVELAVATGEDQLASVLPVKKMLFHYYQQKANQFARLQDFAAQRSMLIKMCHYAAAQRRISEVLEQLVQERLRQGLYQEAIADIEAIAREIEART
ncbi:MAG TPA: glycosyltransferase [Patescibacteria group bacterium]|nr:glycosyltransferase [Patescibacteria group bacterium]